MLKKKLLDKQKYKHPNSTIVPANGVCQKKFLILKQKKAGLRRKLTNCIFTLVVCKIKFKCKKHFQPTFRFELF